MHLFLDNYNAAQSENYSAKNVLGAPSQSDLELFPANIYLFNFSAIKQINSLDGSPRLDQEQWHHDSYSSSVKIQECRECPRVYHAKNSISAGIEVSQ